MKYFFKDRIFIKLILAGLIIRLILTIVPGFKIDVDDWVAWSIRLNQVGLSSFYSTQVFSDYTPGYMFILHFLGTLRNLLQINNYSYYLLLKLPAILAEILIGVLVFKFSRNLPGYYAMLGTLFILLNPALIFNSSAWGQIDSILTLFLVLAVYYLNKNSLILSSLMLSVAFLIKPQAIAIFPLFTLFLIKNFSIKNSIKLTLPFLATVFILSWPFFPNNPIFGLINLIKKTASQYAYTSLFAYNFWGIIGFWTGDSQKWHGLSYQTMGYILFSSYWIVITYLYLKRKLSLYALAALALLGFYFLPTRIHERYLYPGLVFLILLSVNLKSKLLLILTSLLSLTHLLNLYYVYVYYNELYFKLPKVLFNPFLYNLLDNHGKILSFISTGIFIIIIYYVSKKAFR